MNANQERIAFLLRHSKASRVGCDAAASASHNPDAEGEALCREDPPHLKVSPSQSRLPAMDSSTVVSFIKQGVALFGAGGLAAVSAPSAIAADPPPVAPWMQFPGAGMSGYGNPAKYESKVIRTLIQSKPGTTGSGASRTPIDALDGMITPNGLHFERHHSGVPDIDPDKHRLLIHGLVKRPSDLHRGGAAALSDGLTHPLPRMLG